MSTTTKVAILFLSTCLAILALMGPEPALDQDSPPPTIGEPLIINRDDDGTACEEDEDCWDCATMGNLICGPVPVTASPEFAG